MLPRVAAVLGASTALAVAGCGEDATTAPASAPAPEESVVALVNDGDTLRLRDGRRVRLLQIDAPEEESECFGRAATAALVRLAGRGTRVALERDPRLDERDDFGRLLRYVRVHGLNVNVELVRVGAALPFFFRGDRGRHARDLLAAARETRRERRGLWGACRGVRLAPRWPARTGPA